MKTSVMLRLCEDSTSKLVLEFSEVWLYHNQEQGHFLFEMIQGDIPKKKSCVKGGESRKQHAYAQCSKFSLEGAPCPSPPVTQEISPESN